MGKRRRLEICEIEQHSQPSLSHGSPQRTESREASQPTQPHGSSQTIHLARASHPHHLSGTSRPSNPHSSSRPIQSHCSSQPHEVEGDLDVQENEQREMALQRWRTCMEYISNPIQSHDVPLPTSSRGASQVAQPNTTSHIAQPQTTSQVQLPRGSVQRTRSNASHAPSRNSSQPQDEDVDEELIAECEVGIADESGVRNKRGITRLSDVWNLPPTQRIIVKFNLAFVPVGNEGGVLTRFIGTVARKPYLCPINCNWHEVPLHYKEACWNIIQSKFAIPENDSAREAIKKKTLKLLGTRLRDWRCTLKGKYFDEAKTVAQIVATAPPTVNRAHFADLVRYWFLEEGKNFSLKNKRGGDKSASVHTAGSKSYARHAHELEVDSGFAPSRAKLYIPTHTKVDGKPVNDIAGENIEAIKVLMESQPNGWEGNSKGSIFWSRDDIYSQVIPTKKWHGRVPGCGFGPTPKSSGSTCSDSPRFNVADEEERMRDKETIRKLEDKVHAQAVEVSTLKEQVAEMSTLKEQVAFMMRHMPELTGLQVRDGCNGPFDQASPHAHQKSSHASHDIECSNGVAIFAVLMSWSWSVCCCSVMAVVLSELVPILGNRTV